MDDLDTRITGAARPVPEPDALMRARIAQLSADASHTRRRRRTLVAALAVAGVGLALTGAAVVAQSGMVYDGDPVNPDFSLTVQLTGADGTAIECGYDVYTGNREATAYFDFLDDHDWSGVEPATQALIDEAGTSDLAEVGQLLYDTVVAEIPADVRAAVVDEEIAGTGCADDK